MLCGKRGIRVRVQAVVMMLLVAASAQAEIGFSVFGGGSRIDNVNNAGDPLSRVSETESVVTAQVSYRTRPSDDSTLRLSGEYTTVSYTDLSELEHDRFRFGLDWREYFGRRQWYRLAASAALTDHNDNNRDTQGLGVKAGLGADIDYRWSMEGGVVYEQDRADIDAYGSDQIGLYGWLQSLVSEEVSAYVSGELGRRDVTSVSATGSVLQSEATFSPDAVFGPGTTAYRLGADYYTGELGLKIEAGPSSSVRVGYSHRVDNIDRIGERIERGAWVFTVETRN